MPSQEATGHTEPSAQPSSRLHYLDWLRVLAIFGVFLFHALHVFDAADWHIKNAQLSMTVTVFLGLFFPWGMPFFFLIAGTGSWFALRRRTAGQYARERTLRLLIPYIAGCILLWPIMLWLEWRHLAVTGGWYGTYWDFVRIHRAGFSPMWFGEIGFHLWFLGFLFCFSLLGLPLFLWLKRRSGQAFLEWLARICSRRGGILIFVVPLLVVRLGLHPLWPQEHDWADFIYLLTFFALGYVLYARQEFSRAILRDWPILLATAIVSTGGWAYLALTNDSLDVEDAPRTLRDFLMWAAIVINGWTWSTFLLYIGMRFLDFRNRLLEYAQEAVLPFFLLQQPVIMAIAYNVVKWDTGIPVKLPVVVVGSFVATMAIYELIIRRIGPLRVLFGMKPRAG